MRAAQPALVTPIAPPLVLVHGLWDTPRLFDSLQRELAGRRGPVLAPHLPHGLGQVPLEELAEQLDRHITERFGTETPVDLLGFSMGGVISRAWIQLLAGHRRTRRFISVASPQQGSWVALPWPRRPLAGIADMKPGSALLRKLQEEADLLESVECCSFYCATDLMVVPGWRAVLPVGPRKPLPRISHAELMAHPASLALQVEELVRA